MIDRLADAFGWHVQTVEEFGKDADFLLKKGYGMAGPVRKRALATVGPVNRQIGRGSVPQTAADKSRE